MMMMLKALVQWGAALAMALPLAAAAEGVGIYGDFIGIGSNAAGQPDTWYNGKRTGHWFVATPDDPSIAVDFQDNTLGRFVQGSTEFLFGQLITFQGGANEQVTGASMHYCVRPIGNPCSSSAALSHVDATAGFQDASGYTWAITGDPGNDAQLGDSLWTFQSDNFLRGLGFGDYTLEVYFSAESSRGTLFSPTDPGTPFVANFSIDPAGGGVPEPSSLALASLTLGLLAATRRRGA